MFPEELQARERIARTYDQRLGNAVTTPDARPRQHQRLGDLRHTAAGRGRAGPIQAALRADGVPTAIYYPRPLHRQPAYSAQHDGAALPVSEDLATRILALPIHPDLTEADFAADLRVSRWLPLI